MDSSLELFNKLKIKKCFICGDSLIPKVIDRLEDTEKLEISKAAHFMMLDNPREFYTILNNFIKKIKSFMNI